MINIERGSLLFVLFLGCCWGEGGIGGIVIEDSLSFRRVSKELGSFFLF